jgi:anti-sigma factor ChrR (cupin superfamily)
LSAAYEGIDLDELIEHGEWQVLREGIEVQYLHSVPGDPIAALLRYQPGAKVPLHRHPGLEFIHVLSGSQRDAHGVYNAGCFKVNLPGTAHDLISDNGCVVLIIWETPVEFLTAG